MEPIEPNDDIMGLGDDHDEVVDEFSDAKIFVGGLSWQTTSESLRLYFDKFGELHDVALMFDKRNGQPRGFGFVTFKDAAGNVVFFVY